MEDRLDLSTTQDGSSTVYSSKWDAHYHSTHGAIQESLHVFIKAGLDHWLSTTQSNHVSILEYGMGTGLNVILTQDFAQKAQIHIDYDTIEAYPLSDKIVSQLNYSTTTSLPPIDQIHHAPWDEKTTFHDFFHLTKYNRLFEDFESEKRYDVIFYDAFVPGAHPTLWEEPLLTQVVSMMAPGACLVTYCAQGAFKRVLKKLGLQIERLPGPPGKREMTRASKS